MNKCFLPLTAQSRHLECLNASIALLAMVVVLPTGRAATNIGLYVTATRPTLTVDFGNPTDYSKLKPDPISLNFGADGSYFHGFETVSLSETNPSRPPGTFVYGGPGDSWSSLSLTSPTPGITRENPIVYRFDSRIHNRNGSVGYSVDGGTPSGLLWFFAGPTTNVHYRVDWSVEFNGTPYLVTNCFFTPPFGVICSNVTTESSGQLLAAIRVEGSQNHTVYGSGGSLLPIGPGSQRYSGSVTGVSSLPYLQLSFAANFYVGQATRGDSSVLVEYRVFADSSPLNEPNSPPPLSLVRQPDNTLVASWPKAWTGFTLQRNEDFGNTTWTEVPEAPMDIGTNRAVIFIPTGSHGFFRLFKP